MKLVALILLLHSSLIGAAQVVKSKQVVKTLIQQRSILLNGGARASVGGKSRTSIKIDLPENTLFWYYSFSTSPGESGIANLNLAIQLASLTLDPTGFTGKIAEQIIVPNGSGTIDVYLLDQNNVDYFIQKAELNGGTFYSFREGSVTNTRQAVVEIDDITKGTIYLGLKNTSMFDAINITIEVVALVLEYEERTDDQNQALTLGNLAWKAFERGDYDKCLELSKEALTFDETLGAVHFNIALSFLMKGMNDEALRQYAKAVAVTKNTSIPRQILEGAIEDLNTYMDKFPSPAHAKDVLTILQTELSYFRK